MGGSHVEAGTGGQMKRRRGHVAASTAGRIPPAGGVPPRRAHGTLCRLARKVSEWVTRFEKAGENAPRSPARSTKTTSTEAVRRRRRGVFYTDKTKKLNEKEFFT